MLDTPTTTNVVLIIGAIFAGVVSIIGAVKANKAANLGQTNSNKMDDIHDKVNGNLEDIKKENKHLHRMVVELTAFVDSRTYESIKKKIELDESIEGKRRKYDYQGV